MWDSDKSWWPLAPEDRDTRDGLFLMAACVSLSGRLDSCTGLADIREAVEHFGRLYNDGLISNEAWCAEAHAIRTELVEYGRSVDAWGDAFVKWPTPREAPA